MDHDYMPDVLLAMNDRIRRSPPPSELPDKFQSALSSNAWRLSQEALDSTAHGDSLVFHTAFSHCRTSRISSSVGHVCSFAILSGMLVEIMGSAVEGTRSGRT